MSCMKRGDPQIRFSLQKKLHRLLREEGHPAACFSGRSCLSPGRPCLPPAILRLHYTVSVYTEEDNKLV